MVKEAIGYGNTTDEAKEDAISRLGVSADEDIQFEIISLPKSKFLGIFGGKKAEVKAYIELPDKPAKKSAKHNKKNENKSAQPKADVKKSEESKKAEKAAPKAKDVAEDAVDQSLIPSDSKTGKAIAYLNAILKNLGCENTSVKAVVRDNSTLIILDGEGLGVVIGHRGETLDALQHLVSLAASNSGGYFKVTLNIGDYREKREQTLVSLAQRVAEQVKRNSRNRALEPMSAYERRIIHTAVQEIEGVSSASVGEGHSRRVVIFPEGDTPYMPRREGGRRNDRRGGRRPSNTVTSVPSREPKRDTDIPLYGKISANTEE